MVKVVRSYHVATATVLALIIAWAVVLAYQPAYRWGLTFTLEPAAIRVTGVVPGTAAARVGVRVGDRYRAVQGQLVRDLFQLSQNDSDAYLRTTSQLYQGESLTLTRARSVRSNGNGNGNGANDPGERVVLAFDGVTLPQRIRAINRTVISNVLVGILLAMAAHWFYHAAYQQGRISRSLRLYFLFCLVAAIAIPLSFFHSVWNFALIRFRFVALEIAATAAGITLALLGTEFPRTRPRLRLLLPMLLIMPIIRMVLTLSGAARLIGPAHFLLHAGLVFAIATFIVLVWMQYRSATGLERRRVRWLILGGTLSVGPYLLYVLSNLVLGTFIEYSNPGIFNQLAGFALLLFPVSVGIGIVYFDRLDIDAIASEILIYLTLGIIVAMIGAVLLAITRTTHPAVAYVSTVIVFTTFGSQIHRAVRTAIERRFRSRERLITIGLERLRLDLLAMYRQEDVTERVMAFVIDHLCPTAAALVRLDGDGAHVLHRHGDCAVPDYPWHCHAHREHPVAVRRADDSELIVQLATDTEPAMVLWIGPREDGDIYVDFDETAGCSLGYMVRQSLRAAAFYEHVAAQNEQLQHLVRQKGVLIREIHHRVKNNLQVMISLLRLQQNTLSADRAEALTPSIDRLYSMALVHESVWSDTATETIALDAYLQGIVSHLSEQLHDVRRVHCRIATCQIGIAEAVPLGLVVTELVRNALQHGDGDPTITLEYDRGALVITVADSPTARETHDRSASARPSGGGLGFQIVDSLVTQLSGTWYHSDESGFVVTVRVPRAVTRDTAGEHEESPADAASPEHGASPTHAASPEHGTSPTHAARRTLQSVPPPRTLT